MPGGEPTDRGRRTTLLVLACLGLLGPAGPAGASPTATGADEAAVRDVVAVYERAIEAKDLDLFRSVKPNLNPEEEKRLRTAFESTGRHEVEIAILSIEIRGTTAVARLSRRDTLEGSIVSSFPQTLRLLRGEGGWTIEEIGR